MANEITNKEVDNEEVTNKDIMDMLKAILARTEVLDNKVSSIDKRTASMQISTENEIKPNLQLVLENQTEVINQKAHITEVENKVDEVKDDVDVLKIVAQEHSKDIEQLKKRA